MKVYTFIFAVLILTGNSFAQIVLDTERQVAVGDTYAMESVDTTNVSEGAAGENQTWNFNGLNSFDVLVTEYVDASSTPFHSNFPGATIAGLIEEGEIANYTYLSVSNGKVYTHGTTSGDFSNVFTDLQIMASYPFTYNSSFSDAFESVTDMGEGFISKKSGETSSTGDAYGTITLPDGSVHNALRVKSVYTSIDSMFMDEFFFNSSEYSSTSYSWYINGVKYPVFSISYSTTETFGNTFESKSVSYAPQTTTGVEDDNLTPVKFDLKQNFPNPFNPSTKISYTLNEKSFVSLKVYNVIGKEVAVLVNSEKDAGEYSINFNAADLSAGVYFYTLSTKVSSETRKMILLK